MFRRVERMDTFPKVGVTQCISPRGTKGSISKDIKPWRRPIEIDTRRHQLWVSVTHHYHTTSLWRQCDPWSLHYHHRRTGSDPWSLKSEPRETISSDGLRANWLIKSMGDVKGPEKNPTVVKCRMEGQWMQSYLCHLMKDNIGLWQLWWKWERKHRLWMLTYQIWIARWCV